MRSPFDPAPPRGAITELDHLAHLFPPAVRKAGDALFERGLVRITTIAADHVYGQVVDHRVTSASLRAYRGEVSAYCNCRSFLGAGGVCAHVWALARAGHASGRFLPPAWERHLAALPAPVAAARPGGKVLYVLDLLTSARVDRLCLEVERTRPRKSGGWTRPEPVVTTSSRLDGLADPVDRSLHAALHGGQADRVPRFDEPRHSFAVAAPLASELLPRLCATGRFVTSEGSTPLVYDDDGPWTLGVQVIRREDGDLQVRPCLLRGATVRQLEEPDLVVDGVVLDGDLVAPLEAGPLLAWAREIGGRGFRIPADRSEPLLRKLLKLGRSRLRLTADLSIEQVTGPPLARLRIAPWEPRRLGAWLTFDYQGSLVKASEGADEVLLPGPRIVVRDREAEAALLKAAQAAGLKAVRARASNGPELQLAPGRMGGAVRALSGQGFVVEADGKLHRAAQRITMRVRSGVDWFDLEGDVEFEGNRAAFSSVIAALRRGETSVLLDDGTHGVLPEEWLSRYRTLAQMGDVHGDALRFQRSQASLLDALLAESEVDVDAAFRKARASLARVERVKPVEPSARFVGSLREYQREGLGWLRFLEETGLGGCLADDMGLGKTIQVLAHLEGRRRSGPSLIVVPRSLVFNWREEAARFTPGLRVLDHSGPERPREAGAFAAHDLVLTTYGILRRDAPWLREVSFDYVVLDEGQAIKNPQSDAAKAARLLRAGHRLVLSGTPVENSLHDLWSLFEFLNPGMLGRSELLVKAGAGRATVDEDARRVISRALRPFVLRRTKRQVARELPDRVEQTLHCELEPEQRRMYDEVRGHYRAQLLKRGAKRDGRTTFLVLEALLRLRQVACHPGLVDPARLGQPSAKLDTLLPVLQEVVAEGSKALVFSQFTSFLDIVRRRLQEQGIVHEYLDGKTTDRQARVQRFQQDPECRVFLVSLKAGGVGLNLTAAEYVFLLDPWWNPASEAQAIDRAHRIGQHRTVFAYRIVARDTIEEKVLALQDSKRALADAVIQADESVLGGLDRDALDQLLS